MITELHKPPQTFRSVGVLIYDEDKRLLLQKRDQKNSIYFPGLWGVFGGACEPGESSKDAAIRETSEELTVNISEANLFMRMQIDCEELGTTPRERIFFSTFFSKYQIENISLQEGSGYKFFKVQELPPVSQIVPFDLAAVTMFSHTALLGSCVRPHADLPPEGT